MRINADFEQRVLLHGDEIAWQPSPMPGVSRRPLDRIGAEVARATTIVRYDAGSSFSPHIHDGGEEFIVLEGVFQDEHGDFPAGSYVRNPPTSRHTPASAQGCTIFVKLWQFDPADRTQIRVDMAKAEAAADPARPGVTVARLFADAHEEVRLEHWAAGTSGMIGADGGAELLVLDGSATADGKALRRHSWLRLPQGDSARLEAGSEGVALWLKTGHLRHVSAPTA